MTSDERRTIDLPGSGPVEVTVRRDKRLKKSARWVRQPGGAILLRIPHRLPRRQIDDMLADISRQLVRQSRRAARVHSDEYLQARAELINRKYFGGAIEWTAIRWVDNMQKRLGSCTNGGSTDGHIRISSRIKDWPEWVIDYIIAHELAHRTHPDHSRAFWEYLTAAYPLTERARGFIQGVSFSGSGELDDEAL